MDTSVVDVPVYTEMCAATVGFVTPNASGQT